MKTYQVLIDIMNEEGDVVDVLSEEIQAMHAEEAHNIMDERMNLNQEYEYFYVWEVLEEDKIGSKRNTTMSKEQLILIELKKMLDYANEKNENNADNEIGKYLFIQDNLDTTSFIIKLIENITSNNVELEDDALYNELNRVFNETN